MPTWPTIPSGEGYPLVDTGTGEFVSSLVRSHLNATIATGIPLRGVGIDPTGVADSTAAVQAKLNSGIGNAFYVVSGDVLNLTSTVTVPDGVSIRGDGELRFTAGIANAAALVLGGSAMLADVTVTNPNGLSSGGSGGKSEAVSIEGDDVLVQGVTIDGFESGIVVDAAGEFYGTRIIGNNVRDCLGAGTEDRGDGIVVWGAIATVTGNIVSCKAGSDARVGIHVEGLPTFEGTPIAHSGALAVISSNVISGQFRRGIVAESINHAVIVGNVVADATWWGINATTHDDGSVLVMGNSVKWTRTTSDTQGSSYSPIRGPLRVRGTSHTRITAMSNHLEVADGATSQAFVVVDADDSSGTSGIVIKDNTCVATGSGDPGIGVTLIANYPHTDLTIEGNTFRGVTSLGIEISYAVRPVVRNNRIIRADAGTNFGIYGYACADETVTGNDISGGTGGTGIELLNGDHGTVDVSDNRVSDDFAAALKLPTADGQCKGNRFGALGIANLSLFTGYLRNYIRTGSATWDPASIAAAGSESTTITVTGVLVVNSSRYTATVRAPASLQGLIATAAVSADDTVTVTLFNPTGGAIDLASGTWRVTVSE